MLAFAVITRTDTGGRCPELPGIVAVASGHGERNEGYETELAGFLLRR